MKVKFKSNKETNINSDKGLKVQYDSPKRVGYQLRWYFILLLIISPILYMIYLFYLNNYVISAVGIVTSNPIIIIAKTDVNIDKINFIEGQKVNKNLLLIELYNEDIYFKNIYLKKALSDIKVDILNLPKININNYNKKIEESRKNFKEIEKIKLTFNSWQKKGHIPIIDYTAFNSLYISSKNNIYNEIINKSIAQLNIEEKNISSSTSQLKQSIAREFVENENKLNNLNIYSPFNGTIIEKFVYEGQYILKGAPLLKITPDLKPIVHAYLDSEFILYAKKGNQVDIVFPNGFTTLGTIISKAQITNKLPNKLKEPFGNKNALLKVIIKFNKLPDKNQLVEGIPILVNF
jgi:multidrug resistance efflux pump